MKAFNRVPVLAALCFISVLLMTTGCLKDNPSTSNDLQFSAESTISTKAVYGSDVEESQRIYQRIVWERDVVTIASDQAQTLWGRKFCDYDVTPDSDDATASTRQSKGKIARRPTIVDGIEDSGLRWSENASGIGNFWSVYPATTDAGIESGNVKITIPSFTTPALSTNQPSGSIVNILDPVSGSYPMVAHATANANSKLVKLQYYPAFTAFQITLFNDTDGEITLASCWLSSTSSDLCGTFTASIDAIAKDEPTGTTISGLSDAGRSVSVGIGQVLADGQGVTFSIFCLPQDITDLTFNCKYVDSNGEQIRKLRLEQNDAAITFGACKQHRMSLTLTKTGGLTYDISTVMKIIVANAFPNLFDMNWQIGHLELLYKNTTTPVSEEDIRAAILQVKDVVLKQDFGVQGLDYTAEDMSVFTNLESFVIDHLSTVSSISIDGLQHFTTFDMIYADNIHNVSITNCPMTETVNINSQSLNDLIFENLSELKYLTVNEGTANSNLKTLTVSGCPDLEVVNLGEVGKLKEIDLSDCSKMTTLNINLASELEDLDLSGCSSLKELYIAEANVLETLNTRDCSSIESIILVNPRSLLTFTSHSSTLKVLKFIGSSTENTGSQNLISLDLDTPQLATIEFSNLTKLANLTLANLPASVTNFNIFTPVKDGTATSRALSDISITGCNGFTSITIDPADHVSNMNFDSCANLASVTLKACYTCNVYVNPPTTNIVATKHNCPALNSYYTVDNYGTVGYFNFTNQ